jgi:transglutaminase-like putative cysteine protease
VTGVETTAAQALVRGEGVCQDLAHAALGLLRARQIPARYVGGYQFLGDGAQHEPHAWIEVWHPGGTWVGFDPTSGDAVDERYVRVAAGRDYSDAAPVRGHVVFAAPPASGVRSDPPIVKLSIVRISSSSEPLGFRPDGQTPGERVASRPAAGVPSRPRSPQ